MDYPTLVLEMDGCELVFFLPGTAGGSGYPMLASIGTLRSAARAGYLSGIGASESPSVSVTLDNTARRASDLIGLPLRRNARIEQGGEVLFAGVVAHVEFCHTLTLEIAA